jgi:hypothetical protein
MLPEPGAALDLGAEKAQRSPCSAAPWSPAPARVLAGSASAASAAPVLALGPAPRPAVLASASVNRPRLSRRIDLSRAHLAGTIDDLTGRPASGPRHLPRPTFPPFNLPATSAAPQRPGAAGDVKRNARLSQSTQFPSILHHVCQPGVPVATRACAATSTVQGGCHAGAARYLEQASWVDQWALLRWVRDLNVDELGQLSVVDDPTPVATARAHVIVLGSMKAEPPEPTR